ELTYEPVVLLTNDDMVREFLKVYENTTPSIETGFDSDSFYNSVAAEYDTKMNLDIHNNNTRKIVADYFIATVKGKYVLDFGGGTGTDLSWLTENDFDICFCEPAKGMRDIAMYKYTINPARVQFLDNTRIDFRQWNGDSFSQKFDGVLANFAGINSIDDIKLLFQKLNDVIIPGGHIIASLLDTTYSGVCKHYLKSFLTAYIKNADPVLITQHAGNKHTAYLHTPDKLRSAMSEDFSCAKIESISGSGFMLLHCQKLVPDVK
ncbi:MAG TPA: class I SAM-dependent methyltransferase, partial [Bacteroidia bacterium]|nr:class I SAM-dependent methyltransferase [Bacteroidia bacterium]